MSLTPQPSASALATAGAVAGAVSKSVTSPLSRLTILLQTEGVVATAATASSARLPQGKAAWATARTIFASDGVRGFFRGNGTDIVRSMPYSAVTYLTFETYKQALAGFDSTDSRLWSRMLAGGLSGVTGVVLTFPIDVVRINLAVTASQTARETLQSIVKTSGVRALYRGVGVAALHSFPNLAINWAVFEDTKDALASRGHVGVLPSLAAGVVAGTVSTVATFPIDTVTRRMQVAHVPGAQAYGSVAECVRATFASAGLRAFYRGIVPQLLKAVPMAATSFACYDTVRRVLTAELDLSATDYDDGDDGEEEE